MSNSFVKFLTGVKNGTFSLIPSEHGFPDNIQTYGLVSGLWTSTFALGAGIGPFISGLLYDYVGFRKAVIFIIVTQLLVGLITSLFLIYSSKRARSRAKLYKELDPHEPLISSKHPFDSYGGTDSQPINGVKGRMDNGHNNGNGCTITSTQPIKDRKCYFDDSPHLQTNPILSLA